jgi:DNA polymerase-3 subunit alpha
MDMHCPWIRGDINETILGDKYDEARRMAYTYTDIFGKNNFFLEMTAFEVDHPTPPPSHDQ